MSMRISSALLLPLLITGCGDAKTDPASLASAEAGQRAAADDRGRIVCAHNGVGEFARVCTLDRATSDQGLVLTVSHPDGAFHRLLVTRDGRGVVAADGAERAIVSIVGKNQIEVALGGDRYRLPATIGSVKKPAT